MTAEQSHVPLCSKPTSSSKARSKSVFTPGQTWFERAHLTFTVLSRAYSRLHTSLIRDRSSSRGQWRHTSGCLDLHMNWLFGLVAWLRGRSWAHFPEQPLQDCGWDECWQLLPRGPVRHRPREPVIVGSSPTRIILFFHAVTAEKSHVPLCCKPTSPSIDTLQKCFHRAKKLGLKGRIWFSQRAWSSGMTLWEALGSIPRAALLQDCGCDECRHPLPRGPVARGL